MTPIRRDSPVFVITSDASKKGYGAVCNGETASGIWSEEEKSFHINYLELLAAYFALKMFAFDQIGKHILLRLDNTTAVNIINNFLLRLGTF